ncbi:uncharacterized protein A1O9_07462 [Exophiala aquamarina CBS 119918]|uniref:Nuclease S1 n=1 Tax=Exophiala aquamarina CBS 119918 TaxID=1182545 RepID=A0A072P829_9EURO|nr:uncharacterized protein A1O9_07462 [Exophiala aquamarina CBS 119918]KEF55882.1 hypothetical protein A1O9_07462 [Exophiala aquamarina CBS 119918]
MHITTTTILLTIPFLIPLATAWGSLGHRTVAYLASMHFSTQSNIFTNTLLNGQDISEAALFPDKVRHMPQFSYSAGWHFIDARDSPPKTCGINMTRDCIMDEGGCVVSAIANHTARVADADLPRFYRGQSLRFMMHFFGDVHQPLHTEAEGRGGNDIPVVFDGVHTNLHSAWDTLIPKKHAGGAAGGAEVEMAFAWAWATRLYSKDKGMAVKEEYLGDASRCALEWAREANSFICSYVMADGYKDQDLNGTYYDGAVTIIDDLVGKAGRRLAAWINGMTTDALGLHTQL